MATPPLFIQAYLARTPTTTTPATVTSVTTAVNDTLVCYGSTADSTTTIATPTVTSGTSLTWTLQASVVGVANTSNCYMWTATSPTAETRTISLARTGSASFDWGFFVLKFSGVGGFGTPAVTHIVTTGAPTLNVTTAKANSAIVVGDVDFVPASGTPVWRTNAGAFTQECSQFVSSNMGQYGGFHANVTTPGTYAVGMTAPSGQTYSIIGLELQPLASNTAHFMPFFM